jgi:hypothetical protein
MTMFELAAALFVIFMAVGVIVLAVTLIGFLFKLLLIPLALFGVLVKFVVLSVLAVVGAVLMVVIGPILLGIAAVFLVPLLLLGGVTWAVAAAV